MKYIQIIYTTALVVFVIYLYVTSRKYIKRVKGNLYKHQKEWNDFVDKSFQDATSDEERQWINDHFKKVKLIK